MSDIPELIEPIEVQIRELNKGTTLYSDGVSGRREHFNKVNYDAAKTINAQVVFGDREMVTRFEALGPDEGVKGYLVLRYKDLIDGGFNLERGDKIIKLGQLDVEYYLLHSTGDPAAHFSSIGGFTLVRMFFGDRNPVG